MMLQPTGLVQQRFLLFQNDIESCMLQKTRDYATIFEMSEAPKFKPGENLYVVHKQTIWAIVLGAVHMSQAG